MNKYINIKVSEDIHKKIKVRSAELGMSMTEYIRKALKMWRDSKLKQVRDSKPQNTAEKNSESYFNPAPKPDGKRQKSKI